MTPQRRELILRVCDGNQNAFPIVHQLDGFVHAERMFKWMIRENMTGNNLVETYIHDFKCSWLTLGKWVIMMINKDTEMKKVIAGKDYMPK